MKKYLFKNFMIAAGLCAILASCKKDFLKVPPQGQLTEEQALIDPAAADKLVTGAYNTLYRQGTLGLKFVIIADVTSDDADKGSTASDPGFDGIFLDAFNYGPNTGIFNDVWKDYYFGVAAANKAIGILEAGTIEATTKNRLIGEAKFIRALYYFNMVRIWGGVPKITKTPTGAEATNPDLQKRATAAEIYQLIVDDLSFGVSNLPLKGAAGAVVGRANKGAAQALLSKVYLYQQKYQEAYDNSLAVINSGKYSLATDYAVMFREAGANGSESIFEVQTGPYKGPTGTCEAVSPNYSNFQAPRGSFPSQVVNGITWNSGDLGFGLNNPSADLEAAYAAGDSRKAGTIIRTGASPVVLWDGFTIPAQPAVVNDRYNYKAYHSPFRETLPCSGNVGDKDNRPKNIRVIMYAEVLLINAEAAARLSLNAMTPLSQVRSRAGLTTTSATVNDVWNERRLELAMEADRFFDIVRQGRAAQIMQAAGKPFVVGKHELFPIPQIQRDLSGLVLGQNPNY